MKQIALFLATGSYSGLSPFAPGTMGSLVALLILLLIPDFSSIYYVLTLLAITVVGVWASAETERYYQKEDAQQIVIDEIAGMFVTLLFLPASPGAVVCGFVLFRFFDIVKPPPVRAAESIGNHLGKIGFSSHFIIRYAGGLGVMLDDIAAGIYANIALQLCLLTPLKEWLIV